MAATRTAKLLTCLFGLAALPAGFAGPSQAPIIYGRPALESPVRGDPDDLLLLPGNGFSVTDRVVYARADDTTRAAAAPSRIPSASDEISGTAPVVSYLNVPYSLTIRLPRVMRADQSYELWVVDAQGNASNGVLINDARPLWLTPDKVYAAADYAELHRVVKLVGRNLEPAPRHSTRVRLLGPENLILPVTQSQSAGTDVSRYAAEIQLPKHLAVGEYRVAVSRDAKSWVALEGQTLRVRPDPPEVREFNVADARYGGCRADDGLDDTPCIVSAIHAAAAAGGGAIVFGAGEWNLLGDSRGGSAAADGIVVPADVQLVGAGGSLTRLVRGASWTTGGANAVFTLLGRNAVRGIRFQDQHRFEPRDSPRPVLQLGRRDSSAPKLVEDIAITGNVFDRVYEAIVDAGAPIRHLVVAHNEFGAYFVALELPGDRFDPRHAFRIDDSVIAFNRFLPSSYLDVDHNTGVVASELGASRRVDFSDNVADGSALEYLYHPGDARGWRAAFFWHLNNNQEMLLVSNNHATCTGDKIGDGEAIAYDNNGNTFGFDGMRVVAGSTATQVSLPGPLVAAQNGRAIDVDSYYVGHWIQIAQGPGLGQLRKIESYRIDRETGAVTLTIAPAWDVLPVAGRSRAGIARQFWQVYTVGNTVDHRQPLCAKSNRGRPKGGVIALWGQTADSVVEGNRQYDTDGILLQQAYSAVDSACSSCGSATNFQDFVEIRDNTVDGEYRWDSACSLSGILGSYAASPTPRSPPPVLSYGVSISHNTVIHADGDRGGAIDFLSTWYQGPPPYHWPLVENLLVYHNSLRDIDGPPPRDACGYHQPGRVGISLDGPGNVWRSVLYANTCDRVALPLSDKGAKTVRVCSGSEGANSCECGKAAP